MNTQAIFSSQSPDYLIPFQPGTGDTVKVRLRTRKEDRIQCVLVIDDGQEEKRIPMTADLTLQTDQLFCGTRRSSGWAGNPCTIISR